MAKAYSGAVPATVNPLFIAGHNATVVKREGASDVESQETCRRSKQFQSFRVKGDVKQSAVLSLLPELIVFTF